MKEQLRGGIDRGGRCALAAPSDELTRLTSFVKAYDVRGLVGIQLTSDASRALGYAFARFVAG